MENNKKASAQTLRTSTTHIHVLHQRIHMSKCGRRCWDDFENREGTSLAALNFQRPHVTVRTGRPSARQLERVAM
jgi:hypothetical protein